jgi:uncharacterized protein (DUF58 family)
MNYRLYVIYRYTERIKLWFSSRLTTVGKLFLLLLALSVLFGMDIKSTMIYQIAGAVFSLLLIAVLASLHFRPHLQIHRVFPETCMVGQELHYTIILQNQGKTKRSGLLYREEIPEPLPTWQEFRSTAEEGEDARNFFDRKMGYYRWLWLLRNHCRIGSYDQELPGLLPGKKQEMKGVLLPLRRGNVLLSGYVLSRIDPLGLCRHEIYSPSPEKILVLPKVYAMPRFFFPGSRKYHQGGISSAQSRGDSSEFVALRDYNVGDPIKHIDWKSTARTGRTIVKQYRDEYFCRFALILDSFSPQRYSRLFEAAVSVSASILMAEDNEDAVFDLLFVGDGCQTSSMGRGLADRQRILEILASVTTCGDKDFGEMARLVNSHSALLSGIIVVLIDLDEHRRDFLNSLAAYKIPMKVLVLVADMEDLAAKKRKLQIKTVLREIDIDRLEEQLALL